MKRKDLEKIDGLTKEQIDEILGLHQVDDANWKARLSSKDKELENLQNTVKDQNKKLDKYKDVDIEELQKKNNDLQSKYDNDIAALKKTHAIEDVIASSKPKNKKALMALLDMDKVTLGDDGKLSGLDEQITAVKKENSFLFEDDKPAGPTNISLGGNHSGKTGTGTPVTLGDAVSQHYNEGE